MRRTGIEAIGDVPWGTHLSQFYETREDLIEVLVPYFREGLAANESCFWVAGDPLGKDEARSALAEAVPDLDRRLAGGQMEIVDDRSWFLPGGAFRAEDVLRGWADRLAAALAAGFEGLRVAGNTSWLEEGDWEAFARYGRTLDEIVGRSPMLALCSYPLERCGARKVLDVVGGHELALVRRASGWDRVESPRRLADLTARQQAEERVRAAHEQAVRLEQFPEKNPKPVLRVSADGVVEYRNPAAAGTPGWSCEVGGPAPGPVAELVGRAMPLGRALEEDVSLDGRFYSVTVLPLPDEGCANVYGHDVTERRQAERELRRSRALYRAIVNGLPAAAVWAVDPEGRYVAVEGSLAGTVGWPRERLAGKRLGEVLGEPQRQGAEERLRRALAGEIFALETRVGGLELWTQYAPVRDEASGEVVASMAFSQDVTDRRRAERASRESEELLQLALAASSSFAFEWEPGTDHVRRSAGCAPILRLSGNEVLHDTGRRHLERVLPEDRETYERLRASLRPGAETYRIRYRLLRGDGTTATLDETGRGFFDGDRLSRVVGTVSDVTQPEQTAQALARAERIHSAVLETAQSGYWLTDRAGRLLEANAAYARMSGYSREELLGLHISDLDATEDPAEVQEHVRSVCERGHDEFETRHRRKDGTVFDVAVRTSYLDVGGGRLVAFAWDVSERNRTLAALRLAHEQTEQTVRERTAELLRANQTLRMISSCNEALVRASSEEELVGQICRIIEEQGGWRVRVSRAEGEAGGALPTGAEPGRAPEGTPGSTVALPLVSEGQALGRLSIYSERPHAFDEDQVSRLSNLADDLAFGILTLRARAELDHAREVAEQRASQLAALAAQLGQAEQRERLRLARMIHDHLQQLLVAAQFHLATIEGHKDAEDRRQAIRDVSEILDEATESTRTLTAELSPPALHEKGLAAGLEWLGREMQRKHGLRVALEVEGEAEPAAETVRLFLFDAVRELLFNVVKHAGVDRAQVGLRRLPDGRLEVTVSDPGAGFSPGGPPAGASERGGFGLFGIRERLGHLGGEVRVESAPGRGSRFTLLAPGGPLPSAPENAGVGRAATAQVPRGRSGRPSRGARSRRRA